MARLDSVPEVREVAQTAACIGREFSFRLLAELADRPEPELLAALDKLVSAELIFRRGAKPDTHYVFKHALVLDSAYQSLLRQRRQILHARLLKCLEASGDAAPEVLAHHAEAAGLTEQAIQYRSEAADDALRSSANLEAIGHYEAALRIIGGLPHSSKRDQTELVLRLGLGAASIAPKSYASEDVRAAFARAVELCDENTSTDLRFRALRGLWNWHLLRASLNDCARLATTLDMLGEKASDSAFPLMALRIQGTTDVAFSRYRLAKDNFTKGLQLYDSAEQGRYVLLFGEDPGVFCQLYCCWMEDWLGLRDTARDRLEHMLERVKKLDHRYS